MKTQFLLLISLLALALTLVSVIGNKATKTVNSDDLNQPVIGGSKQMDEITNYQFVDDTLEIHVAFSGKKEISKSDP